MDWAFSDNENLTLQWQERGGPEVSQPSRSGFGSRLIRLGLTDELSGEVELIYEPVGLKVLMGFPLCNLRAVAQPQQGLA